MTRYDWSRHLFSTKRTSTVSTSEDARFAAAVSTMNKAVTSFLLMLACSQLLLAQRAEPMTVTEILARATSVDVSCHTYSDQGEVATKIDTGFISHPQIDHFTTAFVRPNDFRF